MAEKYEGRPCVNCGNTTRYKSNCTCVECQNKKYSRDFYNKRKDDPEYLEYKADIWRRYVKRKQESEGTDC
jgi:hypothetical protein